MGFSTTPNGSTTAPGRGATTHFARATGFDQGLWDDVPHLTTPTTLVRGANSFFVNDDDADAFARTAPGFQRTHIVADSGHSVQGDQPAALVEILRDVLAG